MMFNSSDFQVVKNNHLVAKSIFLFSHPSPNFIEIESLKTGVIKLATKQVERNNVDDARNYYRALCDIYNWKPGSLTANGITGVLIYKIDALEIQVIFFLD